ncbi:MAG: DoxX family protein [Acidimicrobiales bacterium]
MDNEGNGAIRSGRWRRRSPWIVAAAFSISGVVHLVHPTTFTRIVPDFLPAKTALVYASGVAELICAAGLWRRARWAGIAAAVLLVAIWPANLQMAINAQNGHVVATKVEDWIRFPLQLPLIWFALQAGAVRRPRRART